MRDHDLKSVIAYIRQSGARAGETRDTSLSLEQQEDSLKEWADRSGYTIEAFIRDHDETGRTLNRPGIHELKQRVRPGVTVAVWKYDRFARNLIGAELAIQELQQMGATVVSTTEAHGKLPRQLMGSIAEYQSDQLSDRLIAIREVQAKRGDFTGCQPPYGYQRRDSAPSIDKHGNPRERRTGPLVPLQDEAMVVQEIYRRFLDGESLYALIVDFANRGIVRRRGKWDTTNLRKIITNPFYYGGVTHKGIVVAMGKHDPLINESDWRSANDRLALTRTTRNHSPHQITSWLEGLIYHACGHRMYLTMMGSTPNLYPNFACQRASGPYRCGIPQATRAQRGAEDETRARLIADLSNIRDLDRAIARAHQRAGGDDAERQRNDLARQRTQADTRIEKARELYLSSNEPKSNYDAEKKRYEETIARITREEATIPVAPDTEQYASAATTIANILPLLERSSGTALRRILEPIGVVIVAKSGITIRYRQPFADFIDA